MDKPLDGGNLPTKVGERVIDKPELPPQGISTDNTVTAETIEGELHLRRGIAGEFEVFCDEAARIGGTGKFPSPMSYMALGTGF